MAFLYPNTGLPPFLMYPRFLLEGDLSDTARLVYILLLDRARLSQNSPQWQDETGRVFVYYTIPHLAETTGRGQTGIKAGLRQLEEAGLIFRKRQGMGNPNRIYVRIPSEFCPIIPSENRLNIRSEKKQVTVGKPTPNHNKRNKKRKINIEDLYTYEEGESL